jgi:unspecific monooxygenase
VPNLFSTLWSGPHAARKRRISNIFSKSSLHASPDFFALAHTVLYDRYLPLLSGVASRREPVEMVELNYSAMMDIASAYLLGLPNSSNFLQDVSIRRRWLSGYRRRAPELFWLYYLPNFTAWVAKWTGIKIVPDWVGEVSKEIEDWCMDMCLRAEASFEAAGRKEVKPGDNPVVWKQIRTAWEQERRKEGKEMTPDVLQQCRFEVASEMLDDLGAS